MKFVRFVSILLIIAFVISLSACSSGSAFSTEKGSSASPILIGHAVALTGDAALWGQSEKNALEMQIEKINAQGGVLGRPIKLISYDTKGEQAEGVNVAKSLVADGVSAVIGPAQSSVGIAASSVFEENKIVMIATTATSSWLTVPENQEEPLEYIFRACFIDSYQGDVAAIFALEDLNMKKAGILKELESDYSTSLAYYFNKTFTEGGGTIVCDEHFTSGELEFKNQLSNIKDAGAEIVFMPTQQIEAALAMKQAKELGMECYFLGGDAWSSDELYELGGDATQDSYFVNIASLADPILSDWAKEYEEKFGRGPVMPNPVLAVDALLAIIEGIKANNSTDSNKLASWLSNCNEVPVLTGTLTIDPKTHNPLGRPSVIETVKDGKFIFLKGISSK